MRTLAELKNIEKEMGQMYCTLRPIVKDIFGESAHAELFFKDDLAFELTNYTFGSVEYLATLNEMITKYNSRFNLFFNILNGKDAVEKYNNGCKVLMDYNEQKLILRSSYAAKQLNDLSGELANFLLMSN